MHHWQQHAVQDGRTHSPGLVVSMHSASVCNTSSSLGDYFRLTVSEQRKLQDPIRSDPIRQLIRSDYPVDRVMFGHLYTD